MKILIRGNLQTKEINIYGTDGKLHTEDFFEKYFSDTDGAYPTFSEEREEFQTDAEWTIITETDFLQLAETISVIQKAKVDKPCVYGFNADFLSISIRIGISVQCFYENAQIEIKRTI